MKMILNPLITRRVLRNQSRITQSGSEAQGNLQELSASPLKAIKPRKRCGSQAQGVRVMEHLKNVTVVVANHLGRPFIYLPLIEIASGFNCWLFNSSLITKLKTIPDVAKKSRALRLGKKATAVARFAAREAAGVKLATW
jgi:hypothetical protein